MPSWTRWWINISLSTDTLEEAIEGWRSNCWTVPEHQTFAKIQLLKRELVFVRKAITPLREVLLDYAAQ